ncbi:MAG: YcxB family protein [Flavitalea sp.]
MVQIRFSLTQEEFYQFNYYTAWAAPDRSGYRLWYFLKVMLLYAVVAIVYIFLNKDHDWPVDFTIFAVIGAVYFLLIPYLVKRSVRVRVRDILSRKENQHVLENSEVIVDDKGIFEKDEVSESRYDWDGIVKLADHNNCIYLYTNSFHAIVIPKRALDEQQAVKLTELFNIHLPLSTEL